MTSIKVANGTRNRYGVLKGSLINGSIIAPIIRIRAGCIKLFVIIVLPGHDAALAEPTGNVYEHYAGDKAEY